MIITNSTIITWDEEHPIIEGQDVVIIGEKITEIGASHQIRSKYPFELFFDARGRILMPGLICAHTHFYGLFSRGMNIPGAAPKNFSQILEKLWWPLDSSLTTDDYEYCALVCLIDAIKHGTTTLFDHHASPMCVDGSLDVLARAFTSTGVRGVVCYETTDRYGIESRDNSIKENSRMIESVKNHDNANESVKATFGLHASLTVSEDTLRIIREKLPKDVGIHIHVAEDAIDEEDSIKKTGLRVVNRLQKHNLLNQDSIVVHGVHLNTEEMEIIKSTKSWVTHQPRSNMNNAVGMADIEKMMSMGIKVCMGNDGFSNAMWDEWRTCYLVHKLWKKDPTAMTGNMVTKIAAQNNADLTSHFFNDKMVGRIKPGYQADLILVDYLPITEMNEFNIPWHIIFGFRDSMVTDTMVNGKWLMNDRKLINLDEIEISKKALELSKHVWKRYNDKF
jgi:putative selenium metabolism protein SsnA